MYSIPGKVWLFYHLRLTKLCILCISGKVRLFLIILDLPNCVRGLWCLASWKIQALGMGGGKGGGEGREKAKGVTERTEDTRGMGRREEGEG